MLVTFGVLQIPTPMVFTVFVFTKSMVNYVIDCCPNRFDTVLILCYCIDKTLLEISDYS